MKKILLVLFAAASSIFSVQAQLAPIPNAGLESWEGTGNNMKPTGWEELNGSVIRYSSVSYMIGSQTRTANAPQGTYFAAVRTDTFVRNDTPYARPGLVGVRFAYTDRPNYFSMQFGYLARNANERFVILINLTKWNSTTNSRDTILSRQAFLNQTGALEPWRLLSVPLLDDYVSEAEPDTASIFFLSSAGPYGALTELLIDDLRFRTGNPLKVDEVIEPKIGALNFYPNPMKDFSTIEYSLNERENVRLVVTDITGREVAVIVNESVAAGNHQAKFERNGLKAGVYIYRLQAGNQEKTGKIIIAD